jgi:hypothetical protein
LLKRDLFGRIELLRAPEASFVRRTACGSAVPGSAWLARRLLARERAALHRLEGLSGVPRLQVASPGGEVAAVLERSFIEGVALHAAAQVPSDFFDRLVELVGAMHRRGVCHNDLHKEQNVLVGHDGYPYVVDFQLASTHDRSSFLFKSRVREDLRHVEKHRRRYALQGRRSDPTGAEGPRLRRGLLSAAWLSAGKPLYTLVTRRLLHRPDSEPRRPREGPWPTWTPPVGPRRP